MIRTLVMLTLIAVLPVASAQNDQISDVYVCLPDAATGFAYKNGRWQTAEFNISDDKYIIRRSRESDLFSDRPWLWGDFGAEELFTPCNEGPNEYGLVLCEGLGDQVRMNTRSMRYQLYNYVGYVKSSTKDDAESSTPFIEIGRCSKL